MDLYIYADKSNNEFKLIRPVYCPSVLLALKGQQDKFLHTVVEFFVYGMMGRFIKDL